MLMLGKYCADAIPMLLMRKSCYSDANEKPSGEGYPNLPCGEIKISENLFFRSSHLRLNHSLKNVSASERCSLLARSLAVKPS